MIFGKLKLAVIKAEKLAFASLCILFTYHTVWMVAMFGGYFTYVIFLNKGHFRFNYGNKTTGFSDEEVVFGCTGSFLEISMLLLLYLTWLHLQQHRWFPSFKNCIDFSKLGNLSDALPSYLCLSQSSSSWLEGPLRPCFDTSIWTKYKKQLYPFSLGYRVHLDSCNCSKQNNTRDGSFLVLFWEVVLVTWK